MTVDKIRNIREKAQYIWQEFKEFRKMEQVIRSGFGLYGIYHYDPEIDNTIRQESVLEHTASVMNLFYNVRRYFYQILYSSRYVSCCNLAEMYERILLYHDVAEVELGDIPDDGARSEEDKNLRELEYMKEFIKNWPKMERERFLMIYEAFQDPFSPNLLDPARLVAENLYLCDKLDAVLKALIFESYGHPGSLYVKKDAKKLSKRDMELMELTGSDKTADIWAASFVRKCRKCQNFNVFYEILDVAVVNVRGESFKWADKLMLE